MKKLTAMAAALLSLGCLGAEEIVEEPSWLNDVKLSTSVGFDSEYIVRGVKLGQQVMLPKAELSATVFEGVKLYVGVSSALSLDDITVSAGKYSFSRTDLYAGATYGINDMFSVDAGYKHYFRTNLQKELGKNRDGNEIFFGVNADVLFAPSAYVYYDIDCKEFAIEGTVAYSLDLAQFGMNNFAADFGAKVGYDSAKKPFGVKDLKQNGSKKNYVYYGANADLVYSLSQNAKIRAGVGLAGNSAKDKSILNTLAGANEEGEGHKTMIFFRTAIDCAF